MLVVLSIFLTAVVFGIAVVVGGYRQFCIVNEAHCAWNSPWVWHNFWCRKLIWLIVVVCSIEAGLSVGYIAGSLWNPTDYLNKVYQFAFIMTIMLRWFISGRVVAKRMVEKDETLSTIISKTRET